jgi:lipopolysaccharide transport system ATP-binding protein
MKPAIRVQNLSKLYKLGQHQHGYTTMREAIQRAVLAPVRRLRQMFSPPADASGSERKQGTSFWALRDLNFEIMPGEVVGIIGRNGAGKSTLLKVLSCITEPTTGRVEIRGRVGSLLEVGTGFHQELTGRENIYMNGSMLGMSHQEIARKFDEIVAFSEVADFLDTPVKRYSSGMYVRLAFAVAAHLEPEILIVDEVLAVGDIAFQRKCLQKMEDVASHGRTVIFVSHNMSTIQRFCNKGLVLDGGRLLLSGSVEEATKHYLGAIETRAACDLRDRSDRRGTQKARIVEAYAKMSEEVPANRLMTGQPVEFRFQLSEARDDYAFIFSIYDLSGVPLVNFDTRTSTRFILQHGREVSLTCRLPELMLRPGRYRVNAAIFRGSECVDHVEGALLFDVEGAICGEIAVGPASQAHVFFPHAWSTNVAIATETEEELNDVEDESSADGMVNQATSL